MTRKEQIRIAAQEYAKKSVRDKGIAYLEFIEACNWADRTIEARVRDYFESLTYQEFPGGPMERLVSDEIIDGLFNAINTDTYMNSRGF